MKREKNIPVEDSMHIDKNGKLILVQVGQKGELVGQFQGFGENVFGVVCYAISNAKINGKAL